MKFVKTIIFLLASMSLFLIIPLKNTYKASIQHKTTSHSIATAKKVTVSKKSASESQELVKLQSENQTEQNKLINYLGNNLNNIGIVYYDIDSKQEITINPNKVFLAGSTVKVQLNMVLANMFQSGQIKENEMLSYKSSDYEAGTGILQGQNLSNPFPITTLSDYSIIHSDNIATNMLLDRIGYQTFRNSVDTMLNQTTDHSGNYITPSQETTLLTELYENKNKNPYYSNIISDMKNTDFHDRLDKYIDHSIVAHKIGDYDDYVNDVGIFYTKKPYILTVYTQGVSNADEVIAQISKMIYDYQLSKWGCFSNEELKISVLLILFFINYCS